MPANGFIVRNNDATEVESSGCSAAELGGRKMNKWLQQPTRAAGSLFLNVHNVKQRDLTVQSPARAAAAAQAQARNW
jgi:hypothetical protein